MESKRTILITGASSGFGFGAAQALAARGHHVIASMRGVDGKNADKAKQLLEAAAQGGHKLDVVEIDVTDDDSVAAGVAAAVEKAGRVDILINNAGVGTWGAQEGFSSQQVLHMLNVNVVGVLRMNKAVLPHMRAAGSGYLIYVSSGLGRILFPFLGPYSGSKHAIEAIAESGSYELDLMGIQTTILQPGAYGTSFLMNSITPADDVLTSQPPLKAFFDGFAGAFAERAKAGGLGNPQEIVDALVELVEADKDARPLRRAVGVDVQHGVGAINDAAAQVQAQIKQSFSGG